MNLTSSKNWKTINIGQLGKVVTGKTPSKDNPQDWGNHFDFITPSDIVSGKKYISNVSRKISETGSARFKNLIIPPNSIIVTCIGSDMGKVILNRNNALTNQQINSIIVGDNFDKNFVYYSLIHLYPVLRNSAGGGSTMPILNKTAFESLEIKIPESLSDQKEIADMLGSLDDKIELLRNENKTLECIAQTLFKEWFVDFNFPGTTGKMIDSELGEIPEGWKVGTLRDVCINFDSKRIPLASDVRAKRKGGYPYYGATQIMDFIDEFLFDGTYLLLAEDASVMDEKGFPILQYVEGKFWVSNHAHVLQGKDGYSTEMLTLLLRQTPVAGIVTGAVQLKINQENLFSIAVVVPPKEIDGIFDQTIQPLFNKLKNNEKEIQTLSKLRDQLLNKIFE